MTYSVEVATSVRGFVHGITELFDGLAECLEGDMCGGDLFTDFLQCAIYALPENFSVVSD